MIKPSSSYLFPLYDFRCQSKTSVASVHLQRWIRGRKLKQSIFVEKLKRGKSCHFLMWMHHAKPFNRNSDENEVWEIVHPE